MHTTDHHQNNRRARRARHNSPPQQQQQQQQVAMPGFGGGFGSLFGGFPNLSAMANAPGATGFSYSTTSFQSSGPNGLNYQATQSTRAGPNGVSPVTCCLAPSLFLERRAVCGVFFGADSMLFWIASAAGHPFFEAEEGMYHCDTGA
eukprot:scaffold47561_cov22-Tisochrysis_lutea.AAC.1